jgi:hypothetical protein
MSDEEEPERLWRPILDLGPHAHNWVKRFLTEWFTRGYRARTSLDAFVRRWRQMVEHALVSPKWDPRVFWHFRTDDIVSELLGLSFAWSPFRDATFEPCVPGLVDLYEKACAKWFHMPDVLNGFVHAMQKPAAASLTLKAIPWIVSGTADFNDYKWGHGLEDGLIGFLNTCWKIGAKDITADPQLQSQFFLLVNAMVARQNHAAAALRDRIARETQS